MSDFIKSLNHCNLRFRPYDAWVLFGNRICSSRVVVLGVCPSCKKDVILLVEERKSDGKLIQNIVSGYKATKLIDEIVKNKEIDYTFNSLKVKKGKPIGFCFGINREIKKKDGTVIIKQLRSDWWGQTELVHEFHDKQQSVCKECTKYNL